MNISAGYDSSIVALVRNRRKGRYEGELSIFDLPARKRIADFPVIYRSGLGRVALSKDTRKCYIGCYEEHGLAAYSVQDGSELWRRTDLKFVQRVASLTSDDEIFCRCGDTEALLLCAHTGRNLDIHHGIKYIHSSPFSKTVMVSARKLELHSPFGKCIGKISRTTFAELDCAFSESEVVITEAGGPVRCFDSKTAKLLWTHTPPKDNHFLHVCYARPLDCFVGVRWRYEDSADPMKRVLHFDRRTGVVLKEVPLDTDALHAFCLAGTAVFSQHLRLMSAETGRLIYEFDQKEE